jgi:hypothetical protein
MSPVASKPVLHVPFSVGTQQMAAVVLQMETDEAILTVVDDAGVVVTATIYWPDHPAVARERATWMACYLAYQTQCTTLTGPPDAEGNPSRVMRDDVEPARLATLSVENDTSYLAYGVALVQAWTHPSACTKDEVTALMTRSPFVLQLVMRATDEHTNFLLPSLRKPNGSPAAASEGT